jgi:hypothetical protein
MGPTVDPLVLRPGMLPPERRIAATVEPLVLRRGILPPERRIADTVDPLVLRLPGGDGGALLTRLGWNFLPAALRTTLLYWALCRLFAYFCRLATFLAKA